MQLILEELTRWRDSFLTSLPDIALAVLIVLIFGLLSRLARRMVAGGMGKAGQRPVVINLFSNAASISVMLVGVFYALQLIGLEKTVLSLLAGAGIIGLALGFAFQDIAENFIAGLLMTLRKPFQIGQVIESNGYRGTVSKLNLRNTEMDTFSGQHVLIPNKEVYNNPLVNYSHHGIRRIEIVVGVAYDTDLKHATRTAREALEGLDFLVEGKPVQAFATEFGDSSINFSLRYWVAYETNKNYFSELHEGVLAIKAAFDRENINIPFPIRTLDFSASQADPLHSRPAA
jgi:small conductance mechanosensitive channel